MPVVECSDGIKRHKPSDAAKERLLSKPAKEAGKPINKFEEYRECKAEKKSEGGVSNEET